jgi:hypothetical protein
MRYVLILLVGLIGGIGLCHAVRGNISVAVVHQPPNIVIQEMPPPVIVQADSQSNEPVNQGEKIVTQMFSELRIYATDGTYFKPNDIEWFNSYVGEPAVSQNWRR